MVDSRLTDYVRKELALGVSKDKIMTSLIGKNWPAKDVESALKEAEPKEQKVEDYETGLKDLLDGIEKKDHLSESKPLVKEVKPKVVAKPEPVSDPKPLQETNQDSKTPLFKYSIIGGVIIIVFVASFFMYSLFLKKDSGPALTVDKQVGLLSKNLCKTWCEKKECEIFKDPKFSAKELAGKNCADLKVQCSNCA